MRNRGITQLPLVIGMLVLGILIPATVKLVEQQQVRQQASGDCPQVELPAVLPVVKYSVICRNDVCKQPGQVLEVEAGKSITVAFQTENVAKVKAAIRPVGGDWTEARGPEPVTNSLSFAAPTTPGDYEVSVAGYDSSCTFSCANIGYYTGGNCGHPVPYCPIANSQCQNQWFKLRVKAGGEEKLPVLLGRVVKDGVSGCPNSRYVYGKDSCDNNDSCHGSPNYTISWSQEGNSGSVGGNSCAGEDGPRYTFEGKPNPMVGKATTVSVKANANIRVKSWRWELTDYGGKVMERQSGTFANPGPDQSVSLVLKTSGDYYWNHLWFLVEDEPVAPTATNSPAPTNMPTNTPINTPTSTPTTRPTLIPTATSTPWPQLVCPEIISGQFETNGDRGLEIDAKQALPNKCLYSVSYGGNNPDSSKHSIIAGSFWGDNKTSYSFRDTTNISCHAGWDKVYYSVDVYCYPPTGYSPHSVRDCPSFGVRCPLIPTATTKPTVTPTAVPTVTPTTAVHNFNCSYSGVTYGPSMYGTNNLVYDLGTRTQNLEVTAWFVDQMPATPIRLVFYHQGMIIRDTGWVSNGSTNVGQEKFYLDTSTDSVLKIEVISGNNNAIDTYKVSTTCGVPTTVTPTMPISWPTPTGAECNCLNLDIVDASGVTNSSQPYRLGEMIWLNCYSDITADFFEFRLNLGLFNKKYLGRVNSSWTGGGMTYMIDEVGCYDIECRACKNFLWGGICSPWGGQ